MFALHLPRMILGEKVLNESIEVTVRSAASSRMDGDLRCKLQHYSRWWPTYQQTRLGLGGLLLSPHALFVLVATYYY